MSKFELIIDSCLSLLHMKKLEYKDTRLNSVLNVNVDSIIPSN